jgi:nucleoside-diphosphate-sugar epimerase
MAGPFVPTSLLRPGRLPVVPWPAGLTIQTMHSDDVGEAFRLVALSEEARGAYNVASDPVVDAEVMGRVLGARVVQVPGAAARLALQALWHLHLVPAEPPLMDLVMGLPLLDTSRIRALGWTPKVPADEALQEVLVGMADHAGGDSPSQAPDTLSSRLDEVASGVGEKSTPAG